MNTWFKKGFLGSEDCLFLQVYSRNVNVTYNSKNTIENIIRQIKFLLHSIQQIKPEKLMPVLMFIHGGGFTGGGATLHEANYLMDQPIVFVTINYRLGSFGYII